MEDRTGNILRKGQDIWGGSELQTSPATWKPGMVCTEQSFNTGAREAEEG